MKKKYFQSQQLLILVFIFFTQACFYSCDKPNILDWTTWESDYFEFEYKDTSVPPPPYLNEELVLRGQMTVSFEEENFARITTFSFELFDKKNNITYSYCDNIFHIASYTCDGNKVTLTFHSDGSFSGQRWTGNVRKTTMDLRIVFGETVKFTKKER